jgi:hypothetical protein
VFIPVLYHAHQLSHSRRREWLTSWAHEISDVAGIAREGTLVELAPVPGVDEELDGPAQGVDRAREAAGFARQAGQIVAQLGVVGLDRVRLALAGRDGVAARIVDKRVIGREIVGVVLGGLGAARDDLLQLLRAPFPEDLPTEDAARGAVYLREDVGAVFLAPTKV